VQSISGGWAQLLIYLELAAATHACIAQQGGRGSSSHGRPPRAWDGRGGKRNSVSGEAKGKEKAEASGSKTDRPELYLSTRPPKAAGKEEEEAARKYRKQLALPSSFPFMPCYLEEIKVDEEKEKYKQKRDFSSSSFLPLRQPPITAF
jgi:hypothetical protein